MSISLVAMSLILISLILSARVGLLAAGGLLLPFGMTAAITAGGTSINVSDIYFLAVGGLFFVRHASLKMPRAFVIPIAFSVLCLVSALILPRLFAGLWVFPVNGLLDGNRVSNLFGSSLSPLEPTSGNLSQSVYVILGMFYLMLFSSIAEKSKDKIHRLLVIAAISNLAVSGIVLLAGPDILEPFRTADYKTLENAMVGNIRRMVGAFPEASRYADFAAPLGVYFIAHYTASGRKMSLYIGLMTTALALLSLSSTAFVAVGVAALYAVIVSVRKKSSARRMMWLLIPVIAVLFAIAAAMPGVIGDLVARLIFDKGDSISGLERGAWLAQGWSNAVDTYFVGAGAGSARSNGLLFVLISNVGIIGAVMFIVMLWRAFSGPSDTPIMAGLMVALVAITASRMVSQTTIAPGIMFAVLIGARTQITSSQVAATIKRHRRRIKFRMS